MTAIPAGPAAAHSRLDLSVPPPATGAGGMLWALRDTQVVARRNLIHIRRVPEKLLDVTIQPMIFVLLFAYVFGSAVDVPNYRSFLMAGIFTMQVTFLCVTTAVGFTSDLANGLMDRFRSLPMARMAVVAGRAVADVVHGTLGVGVMVLCGLLVGWRTHTSALSVVAGFGLLLLFAFAMIWVGTVMGLTVRTTEAAQALGFTILFPLTFVANTFVPTAGLPPWLRTIADWNPLSATVQACRELWGNAPPLAPDAAWPLQHAVFASATYSLAIIAVAAPIAVRRYRSATTR